MRIAVTPAEFEKGGTADILIMMLAKDAKQLRCRQRAWLIQHNARVVTVPKA